MAIMNKKDFAKKLSEKLNYSYDDCLIIVNILEDNFFISKENKDKIINEISTKLKLDKELSSKIYDIAIDIIKKQIKEKLKHPFN